MESVNSFVSFLEQTYGDKIAFRYVDYATDAIHTVTYRQYAGDIRRYAAFLQAQLGDAAGKRVGILARNSYDYLAAFLGIMLAGAVTIPLNIEENWNVLQEQLNHAEIALLLHDGEYAQFCPELEETFGSVMQPVEAYKSCEAPFVTDEGMDNGRHAMLIFTSGSTGSSKAVTHSWKTLSVVASSFAEYYDMVKAREGLEELRMFMCLPMYHVLQFDLLSSGILRGCQMNLSTRSKYFLQDLNTLESDCSVMVPVMLTMLAKYVRRGKFNSRFKAILTAGAAISQAVCDDFEAHGIHIDKNYGMSENPVATTNGSLDPAKAASVGCVFGDTVIRIVDGEVLLKGGCTMLGYYKNPTLTAEVMQDGWIHTGDTGYLDEDGYLYLTGRKKNLIILESGENVSPEELERLLYRNTDILEVFVKEKQGKICAEIFCEPQNQDSIRAYIKEVNRTIAAYKQMALVEFREEPFPRTGTGKLKRPQ